MLAPLLILVLALVIAVAPIAGEMCDVACAVPTAAFSAHSHHDGTVSTDSHERAGHGWRSGPIVEAVADGCGHPDQSPLAAVAAAKLVIDPPPADSQIIETAGRIGIEAAVIARDSVHRPPLPLSLRTPLRI